MRIGVLARGLLMDIGGARKVLDALLKWLPQVCGGHEIIVYQPHGTPMTPGTTPVWVDAPHALWWEGVAAGRAIRRNPPDVLFAPKTLLPAGLPRGLPTVSLVLDLLYFPLSECRMNEYKAADVAYNRLFYRASCRRANRLVCISECTRRDLREVCGDAVANRASVALPGVELPPADAIAPARVAAVRQKYGLNERPYVFHAGSISPRKNMVRGVRAFAMATRDTSHDLVVTAGKSWHDQAVETTVDACGARARFHRLGKVDADDMPALYAGADAFFFPSLYEGFGLPVLEAMACGCPVVTANASSLPEAAGGAAVLADPTSEDAMAAALHGVLLDSTKAAELRKAGLARAQQCTWTRFAAACNAILEEAASA